MLDLLFLKVRQEVAFLPASPWVNPSPSAYRTSYLVGPYQDHPNAILRQYYYPRRFELEDFLLELVM